ncbi:uncharacterized protein LOC132316339 [Cornus florida]|uniref:uncharacterized protein LOC132316339 n=1 Tax=Cornus florida TaxID=4283 RepID=UPI0028A06CB9|nr:uncharacterized protein LOC132316339 [Cornus florida]
MGRNRRARKRREEDESAETECQQKPNSSSAQVILGQVSTSRYPKRSPIQNQATPNYTGTPRLAKRGKKIDNFNSVSKSHTSTDEAELESFYSKMIFPEAQAQQAAALSASHEAVSDNHRPVKEANEASNIIGSRPEGSASNCNQREEHLGQTFSLNLTEMAEMLDDDSFDLHEVGTSLDLALVTVNGYRVKPEWASLLNTIFLRHGDIAKDCSLVGIRSRSSLLEIICEIIQKLQDTEFIHITPVELKSMIDHVCDMETVKLEVRWLHQRLDDIFEAMRQFKGYSSLKKAQRRTTKVIEKKEEEIKSFNMEFLATQEEILALQQKSLTLKEKVLSAEDELTSIKAEAEKIDETVSETKAKVKCFYQKSLMHSLL